jgi:regulator of protease activity HflC (stomatin/prohibitin superfamily)
VIPEYLQKAIQEKLQQKELAKAQQYRLEQAKVEFEIKQVEDLNNQTIQQHLTPEILRLRGIEATRDLATSPNAKVVVIGNGQGQLPIILGAEK